MLNILTGLFIVTGCFFFLAGTLGLLRFPDVFSRLHALTKADNVGLGFIVIGLAIQSSSVAIAGKLVLIWLLVMFAGSSIAHLILKYALKHGDKPWRQ